MSFVCAGVNTSIAVACGSRSDKPCEKSYENCVKATRTSDERDRIKALEREVKELRRANEILKLASAFFAQAELDRRLKF